MSHLMIHDIAIAITFTAIYINFRHAMRNAAAGLPARVRGECLRARSPAIRAALHFFPAFAHESTLLRLWSHDKISSSGCLAFRTRSLGLWLACRAFCRGDADSRTF